MISPFITEGVEVTVRHQDAVEKLDTCASVGACKGLSRTATAYRYSEYCQSHSINAEYSAPSNFLYDFINV